MSKKFISVMNLCHKNYLIKVSIFTINVNILNEKNPLTSNIANEFNLSNPDVNHQLTTWQIYCCWHIHHKYSCTLNHFWLIASKWLPPLNYNNFSGFFLTYNDDNYIKLISCTHNGEEWHCKWHCNECFYNNEHSFRGLRGLMLHCVTSWIERVIKIVAVFCINTSLYLKALERGKRRLFIAT